MPPPRRRKRSHRPKSDKRYIGEFQLAGLGELTKTSEEQPSRATIRHRTVGGRTAQRRLLRTAKRKLKRHPSTKRVSRPKRPATPDQLRAIKIRRENRRSSIIRRGADPTGEPFVGRGRLTQVMNIVISPRGRVLSKGMPSPFDAPPEGQPQSVQDYFLGSRAIRRMAYNPTRRVLEIIFQTGYGYQFFGVPQAVWVNFQMAQSKGRFFMSQIYGHWTGPKGSMTYHPNYQYRRIQ